MLRLKFSLLLLLIPSVCFGATITKSIGTSSRDYSTMTLWEADLDNGAVYAAGDVAKGECYNDSAFDESVTINGGGTVGLSNRILTVASGQRHTGIAGTGVRIVMGANRQVQATTVASEIYWLEIDGNGRGGNTFTFSLNFDGSVGGYMLLHDLYRAQSSHRLVLLGNAANFFNSIIYDGANTQATNTDVQGVRIAADAGDAVKVQNVTIDRLATTNASAAGTIRGVHHGSGTDTVQNVIAMTLTTAGTSTLECFGTGIGTADHNMSSDTTASGTGSLTSKTNSNQFVSVTDGSEDYHLKTGADAIDAGVDLVTTPTGVNFDIDNRDRDANNDTWDMGADEFVAAAGGARRVLNFF